MKVFGIAGYSGSGKTTLMEKLIPQLDRARPHGLADQARAPRLRHRPARARTHTAIAKPGLRGAAVEQRRWVLMHELRGEAEPSLDELLARFAPCDLVLVEGFKQEPIPKLEVHRPGNGKPPLLPRQQPDIVAVAMRRRRSRPACRVLALELDDRDAIADFVLDTLQLQERPHAVLRTRRWRSLLASAQPGQRKSAAAADALDRRARSGTAQQLDR